MNTSDPTICPDCGAKVAEFVLHEDGCPKFGQEIEEFIAQHDAEIATWPAAAREQLDRLNVMQACLFGKTLRQREEIKRLKDESHDFGVLFGLSYRATMAALLAGGKPTNQTEFLLAQVLALAHENATWRASFKSYGKVDEETFKALVAQTLKAVDNL